MDAEKVLSTINLIAKKYDIEFARIPEFAALAQSLREDIALAENKKAGKASRFKAALRFSKNVNNELEFSRPAFAGAFIGEGGFQYIIHPHLGVRYEKPFDGLVEAPKEGDRASITAYFNNFRSALPVTLPSLAELKTKQKLDKAEGKLDCCKRSIVEIRGVHFDNSYLTALVEMVEPTEAYFSDNGKCPVLVLIGEGSRGIVFPIRIV